MANDNGKNGLSLPPDMAQSLLLHKKHAQIMAALSDCDKNLATLKDYFIYDTEFFWGGGSMGNIDPIKIKGDNSMVVKMRDEDYEEYAFKCYIDNKGGREERYNLICKTLSSAKSKYFTIPEFYPDEITDNTGKSFPILKMKWIDGVDIYKFIETYLHDEFELKLLTFNFYQFAKWILEQPFAHGSICTDNIMVNANGDIIVTDYDNMFTPEMSGLKAKQLGDKNFIHPELTLDDFDKSIDSTPLLVTLLSLLLITSYPSLYKRSSSFKHCIFTMEQLVNLSSLLPNNLLDECNNVIRSVYGLLMCSLSNKKMKLTLDDVNIANPILESPNRITIQYGRGHFNMIYVEPGELFRGASPNIKDASLVEGVDYLNCTPTSYDHEAEKDEEPIKREYCGGFWICESFIKGAVWDIRSYGENGYYQDLDWSSLNWPVMGVTYDEALNFANSLSKSFGLQFDLPTENEWEFAAKGGKKSNHSKYSGSNNIDEVAVYNLPEGSKFLGCPLKTKKPNELGIYDMSGLLFEWCKEEYDPMSFKSFTPPTFYHLQKNLKIHVRRGGCMRSSAHECRNTTRRRENYFELYHDDNCYHMDSLEYYDSNNRIYIDDSNFYQYTGLRLVLRNYSPSNLREIIKPLNRNAKDNESVKEDNGAKLSSDESILVACDDNCKNLVIKHGVSVLGQGCCQSKHNLISVELPSTIKVISGQSFWGCDNLESVYFQYGIYAIETQAFWSCRKLKSIELPSSLKYMEYGAFSGCESLKNVIIPEGVEQLGDNNFSFCKNLESIQLPKSIKKIPSSFLWRCSALKSLTIPENVEYIEGNPFRESGLEFIDCKSSKFVFEDGLLMSADRTHIIACCKKVNRIIIPETIESIGKEAFAGIKELEEVVFSNSLQRIYNSAFNGCSSLNKLDIPKGIKYIDTDTFYGCESLKSITIRCQYRAMGMSCFSGTSLSDVWVEQDFEKYQNIFRDASVHLMQ